MKKTLIVAALLVAIVFGCRQTDQIIVNSLLNTSQLTAQLFTIDITKDTTLITKKGAVIKLPKGTLEVAGAGTVQLAVREAYSMQDIIKAGLTTQSNGQPLSSGGMIFINPLAGNNAVKIVKPIAIATPTPFIDPNMQLYRGEVQADSTINWTNPQPLPANPQQAKLDAGKQLFINNCASCHRIERDLTGPKLAHVVKKFKPYGEEGRHIDLYGFTRNCTKEMAETPYFCALYEQWNKTPMNVFPQLTDQDLDALYGYIENESDRLNLPIPENGIMQCLDSCRIYSEVAGRLEALKRELEQENMLVKEKRSFPAVDSTPGPVPVTDDADIDTIPPPVLDYVDPVNQRSLYYQFTIESFGWYNIDILTKDIGAEESTLVVRMQGGQQAAFQLYLAIPSIRGLFPAGELTSEKGVYGFYTKDGKIPLPQNTQAWILAMGEKDSTILFASKMFMTSRQQEFTLHLAAITREAFQQEIQKMGLPAINMKVEVSQTAIELRKVIKELKSAEQLKPKNCNCNCLFPGLMP